MVWSDIFTNLCPGGYQDSWPKAPEHDHVNRQRGLSGEQLRQDQAGHQRHQHHHVSPEHHGDKSVTASHSIAVATVIGGIGGRGVDISLL